MEVAGPKQIEVGGASATSPVCLFGGMIIPPLVEAVRTAPLRAGASHSAPGRRHTMDHPTFSAPTALQKKVQYIHKLLGFPLPLFVPARGYKRLQRLRKPGAHDQLPRLVGVRL
jgi:hypothetical protein